MLPEPARDCQLCPRLAEFRSDCGAKHPDWFNGAVPSFGPASAQLLIVGLAPGMQGANRTGRPFTGDYAGDLLYQTLDIYGFSSGTYGASPDDGLELIDCMITNAVRCLPPQNKPTTAEINSCRPFLAARIAALPNLRAVVALGRIAHDATVVAFGLRKSAVKFGHGARHEIERPDHGDKIYMFDSYHCSRYNTNTGRLTPDMFRQVFNDVQNCLNL
ncbi:MAG: uracil-DNA glycosylase [Pseudomonadota bacterium]